MFISNSRQVRHGGCWFQEQQRSIYIRLPGYKGETQEHIGFRVFFIPTKLC